MKKLKKKQIFYDTADFPISWKYIKHLELQDEDIINAGYIEPFYSENNSWDGYYYIEVTRMVLETDEEYNKRLKEEEQLSIELKKRRYNTYLELKTEFEK